MMTGFLLKLLALYLGACPLYAATPALLSRGPGAEGAVLGRAAVSVVQDPTALYWNPAALTGAGGAVTGEHLFLYDGARYDFAGLSVPSKWGSFGFGALQLHRDGIVARQAIDDPGTEVPASQANYMAGYARAHGRWSAGGTVNVFDYNLAGYKDRSWGADVGGRYAAPSRDAWILRRPEWSFGAVLKNLLRPALKLDQEEETHPRDLRAGLSVNFDGFSRLSLASGTERKDRAMIGVGLSKVLGQTEFRFDVGTAYTLQDVLTLRLGFGEGVAAGIGLKTADGRFALDYAVENGALANNHRFTLTYRFTKPRSAIQPAPTTLQDAEFTRAKGRAEALGGEAFARGQELFKGQRYDEAVESLGLAILLRPDDRDARELHRRAVEVERREARRLLSERLDRQVTAGDTLGAWRTLARLLRAAPEDRPRLLEVSRRLSERIEPDVRAAFSAELLAAGAEDARRAASAGLHAQALADAEWLGLAVSTSATADLKAALTQEAAERRRQWEKEIADGRGARDPRRALLAAWSLARAFPNDPTAARAFESARGEYAGSLRLSARDRLHLRKVYYLAAVAWAKKDGERAQELLEELLLRDAGDTDAQALMDVMIRAGVERDMTVNGGGQ